MNRAALIAAGTVAAVSLGGWAAWVNWYYITLPPMAQEVMVPEESCEASRQQQTGPLMPIQVEWIAPPESWRETVAQVDAIVVGRRRLEIPEEVVPVGLPCLWLTLFAFSVEDAIKGTSPDQRVQVAWTGHRNETVEGFPRPAVGDRYLLFLKRHPPGPYYYPSYGPYANVRITEGRIVALFDGRPLRGLHGRSASEFVAELRGYVQAE